MAAHEKRVLEIMQRAMRAEMDAVEIFSELMSRIENPTLEGKVHCLAIEESQHLQILEETCAQWFPDRPPLLPPSQLPDAICCKKSREELSVEDILECAVEVERRSRARYLEAALTADSDDERSLFSFLADWEFSHLMTLGGQHRMKPRYPCPEPEAAGTPHLVFH